MQNLPIIQKTYDFIQWYIPILDNLPRKHKFSIGDRMISGLYELLEGLIDARNNPEKLAKLELLNVKLDVLRYQTRLLFDFKQFDERRYEYVGQRINEIGKELGGWIRQQRQKGNNQYT